MKEKIKSIILFLLVGLSISMTSRLWLQSADRVIEAVSKNDQNKMENMKHYPLVDMISPNKYLLNFGLKNHTMLYDDSKHKMWKNGSEPLNSLFSRKDVYLKEISHEEYLGYLQDRSLVYNFSEKINSYILAKALDVEKPNVIVDTMPKIDKIYVYLGQGDPFFVLSEGDVNLKVELDNINTKELILEIDRIEKKGNYPYYYSMRETLDMDNDIFIPLEVNYSLPQVFVENKVKKLTEQQRNDLAQRFLNKNIDYIKEIVESNNSSIYIYNQEVLKLNSNGVIEYFNPIDEVIRERNLFQSLNTAANFLSEKSKLKEGMYLANIEEIQQDSSYGYRFIIRYRVRGIPVILGNHDIGEYVKIEVFNNHVRSYYHYLREDTSKFVGSFIDNDEMMSAFDVIDKNYKLLEAKYFEKNEGLVDFSKVNVVDEILNSINDITLAYFDPCIKDEDEELIAVWVIQFNDLMMAFDAYSGMLTYVKAR